MKLKVVVASAMAVGGLVVGAAQASSDGVVNATTASTVGSTGAADIRLIVPSIIQLQVLGDLRTSTALAGDDLTYDGTSDVAGNVSVCVWAKSNSTGDYSLTATGSGAGSAFTLSDGTNAIPYSVSTTADGALTSGSAVSRTTAAHNPGACAGSAFNIAIDILAADIDASADQAGNYDGVLSMNVVTP